MRRYAILVATVLIGMAAPAAADFGQDRHRCTRDEAGPGVRSGACLPPGRDGRFDLASAANNRGGSISDEDPHDQAIGGLRLDPRHAQALIYRGSTLLLKGQHDRAIEDFNEAIRLHPANAFGFASPGAAYAHKSQFDRAIEDLDEAIRLKAGYANFFGIRGMAYTEKGRHHRTIEDFNEAIRLDPAYAEAFMRRGFLNEKLGQRDSMLKDFESAYSLGNRDPILLRKLKEIGVLPR